MESNRFFEWIRSQLPTTRDDWQRIGMGVAGSMLGGPMMGFAMSRGLGGLGNLGMGNMMNNLIMGGRGVGTSFGRMFDNNPQTGFFNNPTAPWNWGRGPANVSQGHPDFVGPPTSSPTGSPYGGPPSFPQPSPAAPEGFSQGDYNNATSQGNWNFTPGQGPSRAPNANFGRAIRQMQSSVLGFNGRGPVATGLGWRSYGGSGGPLGGSAEGGMMDPNFSYVFDR